MNEHVQQLIDDTLNWMETTFDFKPTITIKRNNRLSRVLGRFISTYDRRPLRIELSGRLVDYYDDNIIVDVLKHELIHYMLCVQGKPYSDRSHEFIKTCKANGVSLTNTIGDSNNPNEVFHHYSCECRSDIRKARKLARNRTYACLKCKGKLVYLGKY